MPKIEEIEFFSRVLLWVRFCFYLLGVLLIGGGSRKIYENYRIARQGTQTTHKNK
jgi:hypothetical protein